MHLPFSRPLENLASPSKWQTLKPLNSNHSPTVVFVAIFSLGDEEYLSLCPNAGWGINNCWHDEDAKVRSFHRGNTERGWIEVLRWLFRGDEGRTSRVFSWNIIIWPDQWFFLRSRNGPPKPDASFYMGASWVFYRRFCWIQLMEPHFWGSAAGDCIESTDWHDTNPIPIHLWSYGIFALQWMASIIWWMIGKYITYI